ncbi:MAG: hypothetical protein ACSNEK_10285 [Parachlamydiaceae bacterium]
MNRHFPIWEANLLYRPRPFRKMALIDLINQARRCVAKRLKNRDKTISRTYAVAVIYFLFKKGLLEAIEIDPKVTKFPILES